MPIDRTRYPKNWNQIALTVKQAAGWRCSRCGKQCLKPGEKVRSASARAVQMLTVHHCDYDPANNELGNLKALCTACHLWLHRGGRGNITPGQLSIW